MKENNVADSNKLYRIILTGCMIAIVGISAVVYNLSVPKNLMQNKESHSEKLTSYSKITTEKMNEAANMPATGIPKPTTTTTAQPTVADDEKPYTGSFTAPTSGKVIKDYSEGEMVKSETMGDWRLHNGTDFSAQTGESIIAVQNGTVASVDKDEMWGVTVTVQCPGELCVKYCGLEDSVKLKSGDKVAKGGIIGKAGFLPIESAEESHIHIETEINGESVNPLTVLNLL